MEVSGKYTSKLVLVRIALFVGAAAGRTHVLALASSALPFLVGRIAAAAASVATNCRRLAATRMRLSGRGGNEQQQNAPLHS